MNSDALTGSAHSGRPLQDDRHRRRRSLSTFTLINLLNQAAVISVDTTVLTAANSSGLKIFNPFVEEPVEGIHYRLGPLFGQPRGPDSFQRPRTYQFSAGVRF